MNYIFKDLFEKLHEIEIIDEYKKLVDIENELEKLIQEKIEKTSEEIKKYNEKIEQNSEDKNDYINLLKEKYHKYDKEEYPYYEYFYYSDCLDEKYILEKVLIHEDKNKFPIINKYLDFKMNKKDDDDDKYSLDKLILFNKVLNLINDKYSHKITRSFAEKTLIKDTEIYKNAENSKLIGQLINYYNELKIKDSKGNEIVLNINEITLSDLVIDDNNEIGKTYKNIYKIFIEKQNDSLKDILEIKIKNGIFNSNCRNKINVQQIREDEIYSLDKISILEIIFNYSYRTIIDSKKYEKYNSFEIDYKTIEEIMTDTLLKNKKLLNENVIIDFNYNYEIFDNQLSDSFTNFREFYKTKDITKDDKEAINNYVKNNKSNLKKYKEIIKDFISLINHLNDNKNDKQKKGKKAVCDLIININDLSNDFIAIFEGKINLTVNQIFKLFIYYLELIFPYVKEEIYKYQRKAKNETERGQQIDAISLTILNEYFKSETAIISKEDLENAIRLFVILVLFRETDKLNKIKLNRKNVFDYLKQPDFWNNEIYKNEKFLENLDKLKSCDIPINHILHLYDYLILNDV